MKILINITKLLYTISAILVLYYKWYTVTQLFKGSTDLLHTHL